MATVTLTAVFAESARSDGSIDTTGDGGDTVGANVSLGNRNVATFDVSSIPFDATVTMIEMIYTATVSNAPADTWDYWPYGGDCSVDPRPQSGATVFSNTIAGTAYVSTIVFRSTGQKTVDISTVASLAHLQTAVAAARTAHTIALVQRDETGVSHRAELGEYTDATAANRPQMRVTYTPAVSGGGGGGSTTATEFEEFDNMNQTELSIWNAALQLCGDFRLKYQSAKVVASATAANPVVCTVTSHGYSDGDLVVITEMDQMTEVNARVFRIENPATNTFELADEDGTGYTAESGGGKVRKIALGKMGTSLFAAWPNIRDEVLRDHPWNCTMQRTRLARFQASKTITAATKASPVVVTAASHGYVAGDMVFLDRVLGMVEINDRWFTVGTVTTNTFELSGIDGTTYTTYTSAGRAQKALTPLVPDFGYGYQYDQPTDCLRVVELIDDPDPWEASGRKVLTSSGITVPIRYQRRLRDTTQYDPLLRDVLAHRLALQIVEELTQSSSKKQEIREDHKLIESKAKKVDAQENAPSEFEEDPWVKVRA